MQGRKPKPHTPLKDRRGVGVPEQTPLPPMLSAEEFSPEWWGVPALQGSKGHFYNAPAAFWVSPSMSLLSHSLFSFSMPVRQAGLALKIFSHSLLSSPLDFHRRCPHRELPLQ